MSGVLSSIAQGQAKSSKFRLKIVEIAAPVSLVENAP